MSDPSLSSRYHAAQCIARDAGQLALRYFRDPQGLRVQRKGLQDTVSQADREVEALIRERLHRSFPRDAFLGEESGASEGAGDDERTWVVDPIDGTDCFVNTIPVWCVSLALVHRRRIELGVVYDPNTGELFAAQRGAGATLNGVAIGASGATALSEGLVGVGFSHRIQPGPTLAALGRLLSEGGMYQRNGSGALMLAYVACGRYIGYYEQHINAWDALGALALVQETSASSNDFLAGDGLHSGNPVLAAAPGVASALEQVFGTPLERNA